MRILSFLTLLLLFSACGGNILPTDNEKKAMDKVVEFYGGSCGYSKGFEYTSGKSEDYFELIIRDSELMRRYADKAEMPASNAAYLFYSNLGSEQQKYTHIRVKVDLGKQGEYEGSFPTKDLREIMEYAPYVPLIENLALTKNYSTLWATFQAEVQTELSEEKIKAFFQDSDSLYGPFSELQFQGYQFYDSEIDGRPMVHLVTVAIRPKENTPLSLFFDRKTKELMGMNEQF